MCEAVEKYGDRRAESARLNNLLENVRNLMESMKWSAEQAMSAMKVSEADKAMLLEKLWGDYGKYEVGAEQAMNVLEVNEHDREILLKKL